MIRVMQEQGWGRAGRQQQPAPARDPLRDGSSAGSSTGPGPLWSGLLRARPLCATSSRDTQAADGARGAGRWGSLAD